MTNREAVEQLWAALERGDNEAATASFDEAFVEEWPQSRERIVGVANWLRMTREHPAFPAIEVQRILGAGDVWVAEARFVYPGDPSPWQVCAIHECRAGKIHRLTEFFAAAFAPAEWRVDIVERY